MFVAGSKLPTPVGYGVDNRSWYFRQRDKCGSAKGVSDQDKVCGYIKCLLKQKRVSVSIPAPLYPLPVTPVSG
jgi:hypothetical protein